MTDVTGTREQGLSDLQVAAESGQYLKPFAQLLLAMFYSREKQEGKTEQLLAQLTEQYPANKTFGPNTTSCGRNELVRALHRNLPRQRHHL